MEWITENASRVLEDQQRRAESLQTRAAQVAGFAGAAVALSAPLARLGLQEAEAPYKEIAAVAFFGGALLLAVAIVFSVLFVLRPVEHVALGEAELENYLTDPRFVTQTPAEVQFRTLKGIKQAVGRYEKINKKKALFLKLSAILFMAGLLLTIAFATTIGADRLWKTKSPSPTPCQAEQRNHSPTLTQRCTLKEKR